MGQFDAGFAGPKPELKYTFFNLKSNLIWTQFSNLDPNR